MVVLGFDPGLASLGYSVFDDSINMDMTDVFCPKTKGIKRLYSLRQKAKAIILHYAPDYGFIEDYAFKMGPGARGQDMGEIGGILRLLFYDLGIRYLTITPQHIKKYVTGSGIAKKEVMIEFCEKKFGRCFKNHNACDAYCIARFGHEYVTMGETPFMRKYDLHTVKKVYQFEKR